MANSNHHHRSSLKQKNKPFKGGSGGRSKSRGRVESAKPVGISKPGRTLNAASMSKADRKNKSALLQAARRAELQQEQKMFSGKHGAPRNVLLLSVSPSVRLGEMVERLVKEDQIERDGLWVPHDFVSYVEEQKQRIRWLTIDLVESNNLNICSIMDAVSSADVVVFVASGKDTPQLQDHFVELFSVIRAQGISSSLAVLQEASALNKQQLASWQRALQTQMPSIGKLFCASENFGKDRESTELIRSLCTQRITGISWRERRPYLLVDGPVQYDQCTGIMKLTGFGRGGQPFSANRLIHLQGFGTFALERIALDPAARHNYRCGTMSVDSQEQLCDPTKAEPVNPEQTETEQDGMVSDGDEADEIGGMNSAMDNSKSIKRKVKVPKGTSSYQAAWMAEEDLVEVGSDEEEEEVELSDEEISKSESEDDAEGEPEDMITEDDPYEY